MDSKGSKYFIIYCILAYVFAWLIAVPLALAKQQIIEPIFPFGMHYFIGYGPMLAAIITIYLENGSGGLRTFRKRFSLKNMSPGWWAVSVSPLLFGLMVAVGAGFFSKTKITIVELGNVNFLPALGLAALPFWILTFGIGEEIGWRGFALPRLQSKYSALLSTVILAAIWGIWHLPQFFYLFDPSIAAGWSAGLFSGAVVFTWLFNSTKGSVLAVALWHGCYNYVTATGTGNGLLAAIVSVLVIIWAIGVIIRYNPESLSLNYKVTY